MTFHDIKIVGMHFRGQEIKSLVSSFIPPLTLTLEAEPTNPHDEYAVKALYKGTHIGYVARPDNSFIFLEMDRSGSPLVTVERMEEHNRNLHPICTVEFPDS